jgi:glutathione peroxidase-family protein
MRYVFQFQLIDAIDVNGNPVANSPVYTVYYETPPLLKLGNAIRKDL